MARKLLEKLFLIVCAMTLAAGATTTNAAPLPNGTALKITPGVGSGIDIPCISGSCIGWDVISGGHVLWFDILPGTDGGFIVGKSQASGELNAASILFFFGSPPATLDALPNGGTENMFDDANCTQAACIGKTALKILNMEWNGNVIPLGSAPGCTQPKCTSDQLAGIFVNNYSIDLVGKTWSMDYAQVVSGGFAAGSPARIIFRGSVVPVPQPNCPVVDYAWSVPGARSLMVFGSNLQGATSVMIDGVNAPVFQPIGDDLLWVFPPDSVTWPWKPGTVQVTNANAGCSGSYPKPCTP